MVTSEWCTSWIRRRGLRGDCGEREIESERLPMEFLGSLLGNSFLGTNAKIGISLPTFSGHFITFRTLTLYSLADPKGTSVALLLNVMHVTKFP